MTLDSSYGSTKRFTVIVMLVALVATLFTAIMQASPANAACNGDQSGFGCEDGSGGDGGDGGNGSPIPGSPEIPTPAPGVPGPPPDPYLTVVRQVPVYGGCPVKVGSDGRTYNAIGRDLYYTSRFELGNSRDEPPAGSGWTFSAYYPGHGYVFEQKVFLSDNCLYPPMTLKVSRTCYISTTAPVEQQAPITKVLGENTSYSGYVAGANDYEACVKSRSSAKISLEITAWGFFVARVWSEAQNIVAEVPYTRNDMTGELPKAEIVQASPVYKTAPSVIKRSNHCKTGWIPRDTPEPDYNDTTACNKDINPNGIFQCRADDTPRVDIYPAGTNSVPIMRDGERNKVTYNQSVHGNGLTVKSYNTQFRLSDDSTPFAAASGYIDPNALFVELFKNENDYKHQNLMKTNRSTNILPGRIDSVYIAAYQASDSADNGLKLSQILHWDATIRTTSVKITDISPGEIVVEPIVAYMDTKGICENVAKANAIRAVGDSIG